MSSKPATYVYCLVRAAAPPAFDGAPRGLADAGPPRALDAGEGRWLVVADAPLEHYSAERIQAGLHDLEWVGLRALEHEALVEHLLQAGTVVPMKLFTLFLADERAVADVRARAAVLDELLDALEGKSEWGVRVLVDPVAASDAVREQAESESAAAASAGQAFLMRKKRVRDASRNLRGELRERADELYDELALLAADARTRPPLRGEGRLLLDASFLVRDEDAQAFHAAVGRRAESLAPAGVELALTGPWPAYNFVEGAP